MAQVMSSGTDAARLIEGLQCFLAEMQSNREPAIGGAEPEALHDLRVGLRRTRSALRHARPLLSRKQRTRAARELKWLQEVTGPACDLEVWMLSLPDDDPLKLVLAGHYDRARSTASNALGSKRFDKLLTRWHAVVEGMDAEASEVDGDRAIGYGHERVMIAAERASADADAADLHRLRKRAKELRYAVELFAPESNRALRKSLKNLQDVLGEVQDVTVQREWITTHAGELGPIDVRLKELDIRDADARARFAEQFEEFLRHRPRGRHA